MAEYWLLTTWRIEAPLELVYAAIRDSLCWPDWWSGVQKVEQVAAGDADGIHSVWRYAWRGRLPYQVAFEVSATRIEKLVAIEGTTRGDLEGVGRWHFSRQGTVSIVRCEWHVRSTRWWMNLIASVARQIFIRNHALLMKQGGVGLAHLLGAPLVGQETINMLAKSAVPGRWQERGRGIPALILLVGLGAGVIATVAQLFLWWLSEIPLLDTLLRDARLTAALVMGPGVLHPPSTAQWDILLVATLIHFALSVVYALVPAYLYHRLRIGPALFVGLLYGLVIYVVNLYGFTLFFPWFTVARDWITLVAHLAFGVALVGGCQMLSKHA